MMRNSKIETARAKTGLTQEQIAVATGISTRAYQYYEAGIRLPQVDVAIRIADALNSTVDYLFREGEQTK